MSPRPSLAAALLAIGLALAPMSATYAETLVYPSQATPDNGFLSPITAAFVAAVGPFNGYLEASDQLAAERATGRVRGFAERAARGRAAIIVELETWAAGIRRERYDEAHAPSIDRLGPVFGLVADPINLVVVPADLRQRGDYIALERLAGGPFDALYASSQAATLRQLEATYVDYIKNGDDQTLRALSVRDLGRVRALLAEVPRR